MPPKRTTHLAPPLYPPPPTPMQPPDLTTLIGIRGFTTGKVAFRRPASDFPTFDDILLATYAAFSDTNPEEYGLHLHFWQGTPCDGKETLLDWDEWNGGIYFIGGSIEFFAHFEKREPDSTCTSRQASMLSGGDPGGSMGPPAPLPPGGWGRGLQPFPGIGGHPPPYPYPPPGYPAYRNPQLAPSLPPPAPRSAPSHQPARRRRMNQDSTTVYSLCPAMPVGGRTYYSAPYVFIPYPARGPRPASRTARITEPYPGFQFPEESAPITSEPSVAPVISGPTIAGPSAGRRSEARLDHRAPTVQPPFQQSSSSSDDRLSSPEYDWNPPMPTQPPESEPTRELASRESVESDGLFVPDSAEPPTLDWTGDGEGEAGWSDERPARGMREAVGDKDKYE